jgi:hypothetical protein
MSLSVKIPIEKLPYYINSELYTPEIGAELLRETIKTSNLEACKILAPIVNLNNIYHGWSALNFVTIMHPNMNEHNLIDILLKAEANPNDLSPFGDTPLPHTIETFKLLLDYGMHPIHGGKPMIECDNPPANIPADKWKEYIDAINEHSLLDVKGAID